MERYTKVAIPTGRLFEGRKLIAKDEENKIKFIRAKPIDIPFLVENGYVDMGVTGADTIYEYGSKNISEISDLDFGKCKIAVAGIKGEKEDYLKKDEIKVATKYPNIAKKYFDGIGKKVSFIKLNGSLEFCPTSGVSDVIVDIVETGRTLAENDLEVYQDIMNINAKLISKKGVEIDGNCIKRIV